jgi:hypothetical protein
VDTTLDKIQIFSASKVDSEMFANYSPGSRRYATIWDDVVNNAEAFNDPGRFTALIAFEWTSLVKSANLHRNVIDLDTLLWMM